LAKARGKSKLEAARQRMYRELVFECAEQLFAEKGFDDTSMQDIAAEAGVSLKTVYGAFPGKKEIHREIHVVRGLQFLAAVNEAIDEGETPIDKLARGVRAYVDFLIGHQSFLKIHLRERVAWGLGPATEEAVKAWERGLAKFTEVLELGMACGDFHDGDPAMMAMMGIAIMQVQLAPLAGGASSAEASQLAEEILLQLERLLCTDGARESLTRQVARAV
jgi:AcrR family transcriptional regulator